MDKAALHIGAVAFIHRFGSSLNAHVHFLYWRDEAAVRAWRNQGDHRAGQAQGRATVFANYRIRVAQVLHDSNVESVTPPGLISQTGR